MIKVTKQDIEYMVANGIMVAESGKYKELKVTGKNKKGCRKNYYVPDYIFKRLKNKN